MWWDRLVDPEEGCLDGPSVASDDISVRGVIRLLLCGLGGGAAAAEVLLRLALGVLGAAAALVVETLDLALF